MADTAVAALHLSAVYKIALKFLRWRDWFALSGTAHGAANTGCQDDKSVLVVQWATHKGMGSRLLYNDDKDCVDVVRNEAISQIIKWCMES